MNSHFSSYRDFYMMILLLACSIRFIAANLTLFVEKIECCDENSEPYVHLFVCRKSEKLGYSQFVV